MDATRNEYLLASMLSRLVSESKKIVHRKAEPKYGIAERVTIEYDMNAVDLLLRFCNEYATSVNTDLFVEIPTEEMLEFEKEMLTARLAKEGCNEEN